MESETNLTVSITYHPPSPEVLEHLAFHVCQELGDAYTDPAVVRSFGSFLNAVARIQANNRNRELKRTPAE